LQREIQLEINIRVHNIPFIFY